MLESAYMAFSSKAIRTFLFTVGALVGIVLLTALALLLFFDINGYKPRVEAALSSALRMTVTIEGPLRLALLPGLRVTLENVRVRNQGAELALVQEVDLAIPLLSLFEEKIRYSNIATKGARISIERYGDGNGKRNNYERQPTDSRQSRPLDLPKISFAGLTVVYADKQSESQLEFNTCKGELNDMRNPGGEPFLKQLSFRGQFSCGEVRGKGKGSPATDLKFSVVAREGVFDFAPITIQAYGGQGSAKLRVDRSREVPTLELSVTLSKFRIEELLKPLSSPSSASSGKSVSGPMNFSTSLTARGASRLAMRQSAQGDMSLSGSNLKLAGVDLDGQLRKFELSQNLSLLDVSALLIAGPVSLVVTKGFELATPVRQAGVSTSIHNVISRWKVEKGIAHAVDVALTTDENRVAVQGNLDFVGDTYQGIVVALVDANGCAKARQKISGPFNKPVADQSNILVPVGPLLKLLDSAKKLILGSSDNCEVFYSGSLPSPK